MSTEAVLERAGAGADTGAVVPCPNCVDLGRQVAELRAEFLLLRAENEKLRAENQRLRDENERLKDEVRRGKRSAGRFSREKKKENPKRPGRKAGVGTFSYREKPADLEVTETVVVPLSCCPECEGSLRDKRTHEHLEVDIPPVVPHWKRYLTESGYCPKCRKRVRSRHADQISLATGSAGVVVGPRAKALAADMKHRLGVPYRKITDLFRTAFGLEVTPSALCQAGLRLARKSEDIYSELAAALADSKVVHGDDTGWLIAGDRVWLWVLSNREITLYAIDSRRSHQVVVDILSDAFEGVFVSDALPTFDAKALSGWKQQKCLAHLLRNLSEIEEGKRGTALHFPRAVSALLREALELGHERTVLEGAVFEARRADLERRFDHLIREERRFSDPDNIRIAKRLRKHRAHLFRFLEEEGVDATNNQAERDLRPAVIVRKTGGCNKSPPGARTHEVLASILATLKKQGRDIMEYLPSVLRAPGAPPALLTPARA